MVICTVKGCGKPASRDLFQKALCLPCATEAEPKAPSPKGILCQAHQAPGSEFAEVQAAEMAAAEELGKRTDEFYEAGVYRSLPPRPGSEGRIVGLCDDEPQLEVRERRKQPHYTRGGLECIDAMRAISTQAEFVGFCRLTAFKYLWRLGEKDDPAKELRKAEDYIRWARERLEGQNVQTLKEAAERVLGRGRK